jgi:hypothetical protein
MWYRSRSNVSFESSDGACWNAKVLAISQLAGTDSASNLRPRPYGRHAALVPMNLNLNRAPLISSHIRVRVQARRVVAKLFFCGVSEISSGPREWQQVCCVDVRMSFELYHFVLW